MLTLVIGLAGTGKTTYLYNQLEQTVLHGRSAILLVPEQYSFASEKALYRKLGAHGALSVEVLSFTRLCDRIFREYGSLAGRYADKTAKNLIMSLCLGELKDTLSVYRKQFGNAAFISSLVDLVSELKTAGISAPQFEQAVTDAQKPEKLLDLSLIYAAFDAMLGESYRDGDDDLRRAEKLLEGQDFFSRYDVFIDGFMAFMGGEYALISRMLEGAPRVTAALTTDGLQDDQQGLGVLSSPKQTASRLIQLAQKNGVEIGSPIRLSTPCRYRSEALAYLSVHYPDLSAQPFEGDADGTAALIRTENPYQECACVAAEICRLVRQEGIRYRDIAVIARDLEPYNELLPALLDRYDIPFFMDRRADIQTHPLIGLCVSAIDALRRNFDPELLLRLAKSPLLESDPLEVALLENYCYTWNVQGKLWLKEFTNNPDGLQQGFTPAQSEQLERINGVRLAVITPLLQLQQALTAGTGMGFARGLYGYLCQVQAAEHLTDYANRLPLEEQKRFLDDSTILWDVLMDILDLFATILGEVQLSPERLSELFQLSVDTADLGQLPQTLDQVIVGTADRIRPVEPKVTFVIGVNEGVFPADVSTGGILSGKDRKLLDTLEFISTVEQKMMFERFYAYFALTTAGSRLWISYPVMDISGKTLAPSRMAAQLEQILGRAKAPNIPLVQRVVNEKTLFMTLARQYHRADPETAALAQVLDAIRPDQLRLLDRCGHRTDFVLRNTHTARRLFGADLRLSPSKVEQYEGCPFSFFCASGLGLRERPKTEFSPLESGSLIHLVLQRMVDQYGGKGLGGLTPQQLRPIISAIINEYLGQRVEDMESMPAAWKYLFNRLVNTLVRLILRLAQEFAQSAFEPVAFELPIRSDSRVQPLTLVAADGGTVVVEGIVDRVDVYLRDQIQYVRVVDYKSGSKEFRLSDVLYGMNMQMLIYLFAIWQNGLGDERPCLPAGVLYLPAKDSLLSAQRHISESELQSRQQKKLRMNGLILHDVQVISAMEQDMAGVFIPAKLKKDGTLDAKSSVATLQELGELKGHVEQLICHMAENLHGGRIEAYPVQGMGYDPCGYCAYKGICLTEQEDPKRMIKPKSPADEEKEVGEGGS